MRVLLWHVHGSYTTALVHGPHEYLLPVLPDRGPDGRGRARTWDWPASARECTPAQLRDEAIDVIVLQRPTEVDLARRWTGRVPGRDVAAVYLEHNAPEPHPVNSRHAMAVSGMPIVHVTHFNRLFWDTGAARVHVIEHAVVDPGDRYTGEFPHAAVVINEPVRRDRTVGADLLGELGKAAPIDLFGMPDGPVPGTTAFGDIPQNAMHTEIARRRVYLHPARWTSLGLSLIEAMHLAMPVVAVAATEVVAAVPREAGVVATDVDRLTAALRTFVNEPDAARAAGQAARAHALTRYGLGRFLADWDRLLEEITS
jgi:Glycosyl transferases group 1